ncbi:site-specific integrase [Nocardia sp. CA-107356]|uniref:site-specific integrase n=1 Tax=Nocardia sp. CA-107356 TaxID=3239972 RepID=UPI003D8D7BFC
MSFGDRDSWTVVDGDAVVVEPVESFLAHLHAVERSPNTVRAYAHDLRDWFDFCASSGLVWSNVRLEDVGRFVAWLRLAPDARLERNVVALATTPPAGCSESTVNRKLSVTWNLTAAETVSSRYDHGLRRFVGHDGADGEVAGARPPRAGRCLVAGVDRSRSCASDD